MSFLLKWYIMGIIRGIEISIGNYKQQWENRKQWRTIMHMFLIVIIIGLWFIKQNFWISEPHLLVLILVGFASPGNSPNPGPFGSFLPSSIFWWETGFLLEKCFNTFIFFVVPFLVLFLCFLMTRCQIWCTIELHRDRI